MDIIVLLQQAVLNHASDILDRFDSVIFVAPFVYYLLALTMNLG